jgi:YjbE family integral membrane protein
LDQVLTDTAALVQVILIDLALSADNAVAVGLVASGLPAPQRNKAVTWGILIGLVLRIVFGLLAVSLLRLRGLLAVGGVLLLWIAVRMWLDLRKPQPTQADVSANAGRADASFMRALISIVVANIALSLDNVLAVAGVARHAPWIMAFGLVLSVLLMGVAASLIARLIQNNRWIGYLGVIVIIAAGLVMIWDDAHWAGAHGYLPFAIQEPPRWLGGQP